nr:D-alanyl-D-alanine carboxypeptidase family protein [Thalassococcus arenae]
MLPAAVLILTGWAVSAAPQAHLVLDVQTGAVLSADNADTPLHPASLTKMMTLYLAFDALKSGTIAANDPVTVSASAAAKGGSSLHLRDGDRTTVQALILGTAIRSANDAATALAEAIGGTEAAFVARMNDTARRLGLTATRFRNPHGLTASGHLSTARDMAELGRRLAMDHPEFFSLFRQRTARIGTREIAHTNRRFLGAYDGADGIKTGYTRAAGYNLTASARRSGRHLIVTVFGATSSAERTETVARLMDRGFSMTPDTDTAPLRSRPTRPETAFIAGLFPEPGTSGPQAVRKPRPAMPGAILLRQAAPPAGNPKMKHAAGAVSLGGLRVRQGLIPAASALQ